MGRWVRGCHFVATHGYWPQPLRGTEGTGICRVAVQREQGRAGLAAGDEGVEVFGSDAEGVGGGMSLVVVVVAVLVWGWLVGLREGLSTRRRGESGGSGEERGE